MTPIPKPFRFLFPKQVIQFPFKIFPDNPQICSVLSRKRLWIPDSSPKNPFSLQLSTLSFILAEKHSVPVVYHQVYLNQTVGSTTTMSSTPHPEVLSDTSQRPPRSIPRRRYPRDPSRKNHEELARSPSVLPGLLPRRHSPGEAFS